MGHPELQDTVSIRQVGRDILRTLPLEKGMRKDTAVPAAYLGSGRSPQGQVKKIKVHFNEIQKAMEDIARDTFDYYFDKETGQVIPFSYELLAEMKKRLCDEDGEELNDDLEYIEFDEEPDLPDWMTDEVDLALEILLDEGERYVRIPERDTGNAFRSMHAFTETVSIPELKEKLADALQGKGAFRRFKDILLGYQKERKRWHGFDAREMKNTIRDWLRSLGMEGFS